jgi:hypothetical protein
MSELAKKCPSCNTKLHHPLHRKRHARYLERHCLAVRRKQREYAQTDTRCRYCGGPAYVLEGRTNASKNTCRKCRETIRLAGQRRRNHVL